MMSVRRTVALVGLAVSALTATGSAGRQDDGRPRQLQPTVGFFKAAVDLVTVNVAVTDGKDRPVSGLGRDDFQVLEDGISQDVSFFVASEVPLDVALLIDSSSSMRAAMPLVEQAAMGFVDALGPSDRAAVMGFASHLRVLQSFTTDRAALETAIHSVVAHGDTALYSALYVALDSFQRVRRDTSTGLAGVRRQAIVVLTDGEDTTSPIQYDDLLDRARRAGVAIYPIAIATDADLSKLLAQTDAKRFFTRAEYGLKTLARETGARAFFPTQLSDLGGVYRLVAEELSTQYALGYVPKVERRDGSYRRIAVRITSRPDVSPRTRAGYYSPGPALAAIDRPRR
jgi:Ca-activated chloride channel homolog